MIQSQFLKYDLVKSNERIEQKQRTAQQYRSVNKQSEHYTRRKVGSRNYTRSSTKVESLLNSNRILSIRSIRITEQQYLKSRSFNLDQFSIKQQQKQRRRSGTDQLSSKQLRLNCLYPKTYVTQQEIELAIIEEQQRTKERKKTLLKRMSSILIKNQTVLKNFNTYNRMSKQDTNISNIKNRIIGRNSTTIKIQVAINKIRKLTNEQQFKLEQLIEQQRTMKPENFKNQHKKIFGIK